MTEVRQCKDHWSIFPGCDACRHHNAHSGHDFGRATCDVCYGCDCLSLLRRARQTLMAIFDEYGPRSMTLDPDAWQLFKTYRTSSRDDEESAVFVPLYNVEDKMCEDVTYLDVVPAHQMRLETEYKAMSLSIEKKPGIVVVPGVQRYHKKNRMSKWVRRYVAPLVGSTDVWLQMMIYEWRRKRPCDCITTLPKKRCKRVICSLLVNSCAITCDDLFDRSRHLLYGDVVHCRWPVGVRRGHVRSFGGYDKSTGGYYEDLRWHQDMDDHTIALERPYHSLKNAQSQLIGAAVDGVGSLDVVKYGSILAGDVRRVNHMTVDDDGGRHVVHTGKFVYSALKKGDALTQSVALPELAFQAARYGGFVRPTGRSAESEIQHIVASREDWCDATKRLDPNNNRFYQSIRGRLQVSSTASLKEASRVVGQLGEEFHAFRSRRLALPPPPPHAQAQ